MTQQLIGGALGQIAPWILALYNGVNPKLPPYNAAGDGTTDDTAAVAAAFAAAASAGGGLIFFPPGTYKITGILNAPSHSVIYGYGATLDIQTDHTLTGRYLGIGVNGGAAAAEVAVCGLRFTCSNASSRMQSYGLISVFGGTDITIDDVKILSGEGCGIWTGTPGQAITTGVHRLHINRPTISGVLADGIHISRGAQDCWVVDAYVDTTGDDGIALNGLQTDDGVHNYDQVMRCHVVNPTVRDITAVVGSGVVLNGCLECDVTGGSAYNINNPAANSFGLNVGTATGGVGASTYTATRNRISGFHAATCKGGIQIGVATDTALSHVQSTNHVGSGSYGLGMIGSTRTHVEGGRYTGSGSGTGFGIFGSSNTGCNVIGADLRNNLTGPASIDSGTILDPSCVI